VDKAIITVLLIIGGVTTTLAIMTGIMPAVNKGQSAIVNAANKASERIESRIQIIQANATGSEVHAWVKNTGTTTILDIPHSDIFLGSEDTYVCIACGGSTLPYWSYSLLGGATEWRTADTLAITVYLSEPIASSTYTFKMVLPSGVSAETTFSAG
jgi:hypothetical protein